MSLLLIVSKSKVVIFGGATGDTGKYIITGDTYALDLISSKWSKLEGKCSEEKSCYDFYQARAWHRGRLLTNPRALVHSIMF